MKEISGGICAATGFTASGIHCGIKPTSNPSRNDLALIYSEVPCHAAGMFTTNKVKADPVWLDIESLKNGQAQAVIANSYIANACAPEGMERAKKTQELAAKALNVKTDDVIVSSTGVIGVSQNVDAIEKGLPEAVSKLSKDGSDDAAHAIMTTDTVKKEFAYELTLGGKTVCIGGISKGSGMIHPHMGTMLCYITTDAAISVNMLNAAQHYVVERTFNRISVDGDMSTNDTCVVLANGMAGNSEITTEDDDFYTFRNALMELCTNLAKNMAADGEGASHLITCNVHGASDEASAEVIGKSVINSSLTKAAIFGADANWGRVLCAMGYSGADFDPDKTDISFASENGSILVCKGGKGVDFDEDKAKEVLSAKEVIIDIEMGEGSAQAVCWGCDLTYEYVKINGDYRT